MSNHLIKVEIIVNDNELDCHWSLGMEVGAYLISANLAGVKYWSSKVRECLNQFVSDYKTPEAIDVKERKGIRLYREHLQQLATAGNALYRALCDDSKHTTTPEEMRDWLRATRRRLADRGDSCFITFMVPDNVHVPWGLIYDADPAKLSMDDTELPTMEEYEDFWCIKFGASSVHSTIPLQAIPGTLPGESFQLLSAINQSVYGRAYSVMPGVEQAFVETFWGETNIQGVFSEHQLREAWSQINRENGILYFYCHANGTTIELSETEPLSAEELHVVLLRAKRSPSVNLAFFNGCNTAIGPDKQTGENGRSFMEIIKALEFRGYIGTEAKIPDVFALRFGFDFLFYFLNGNGCLLEAMGYLRRKHWPLSLVYTINCDPLIALSRKGVLAFPDRLSDDNFSTDRIGSNLLHRSLGLT